jgi:CHRD domain-containing protein
MKLLTISVLAVAALAGLGSAAAKPPPKTPKAPKAPKVTLCHRTPGATRPYVRITVASRAALRGHMRHAADIIPAAGPGCPTAALSPTQGGTALTATLRGSNEVPAGDPDGMGTATLRAARGAGLICYQISVSNITLPATAAHVHVGAAGTNGDVVLPLAAPGTGGSSAGCATTTRTLVAAILDNPSGYYANVHTSDFPDGAIRGQLG